MSALFDRKKRTKFQSYRVFIYAYCGFCYANAHFDTTCIDVKIEFSVAQDAIAWHRTWLQVRGVSR